jgi:hypothetical protein
MKINFFLKTLIFSFFLFLGSIVFANNVSAAKLYLSPSDKSITKSTEFEINLVIDTEGSQVFGAEAKINYSSSDLELKSVSNGGFFTDFLYPTGPGLIEIKGYLSSMYDTKSGNGNLAVLKFLAKNDSGSTTISFDCGGTQILDTNGTNILSCGALNQANITFTNGSTGGTDTGTQTDPNSCDGTCGSNYNCKSQYYCYQGFCRNPACPTSTNCVCTTANTTIKPSVKPKASLNPSPTPQVVTLEKYSTPSGKINEIPEETEAPLKTSFNILKYLPYLGILVLVIILLVILSKMLKKGNDDPPTIIQGLKSTESNQEIPQNQISQTPPVQNQEYPPTNSPQTPDSQNPIV